MHLCYSFNIPRGTYQKYMTNLHNNPDYPVRITRIYNEQTLALKRRRMLLVVTVVAAVLATAIHFTIEPLISLGV